MPAIYQTLSLGFHVDVDLTRGTYLNVADQVHPFKAKVFPDGRDLSRQDNVPCYTAKIVQEWFERHDEEFKVLSWPLMSWWQITRPLKVPCGESKPQRSEPSGLAAHGGPTAY